MVHCVAFGCTNRSDRKKEGVSIHFFSFPTNIKQKNAWIYAMKREGYVWKHTHRVCSAHFNSSDYEVDPQFMARYGYTKAKPKLKSEAVPIVTVTAASSEGSVPQRGAYAKRRKLETLEQAFQEHQSTSTEESDLIYGDGEIEVEQAIHLDPGRPFHSVKTQTQPLLISIGIQCSLSTETSSVQCQTDTEMSHKETQCPSERDEGSDDELESMDDKEYVEDDEFADPTYSPDIPLEENEEDAEVEIDCHDVPLIHNEPKFLVFQSCLLDLFANCFESSCFGHYVHKKMRIVGTMVVVTAKCSQGHEYTWYSQPRHNALPWGNIMVAASILFSGSSFSKMSTYFQHLKVPFISKSTYFLMQKVYLIPVVAEYWANLQDVQLGLLEGEEVCVGGDGRCDSPGYTAKYGTYTIMDVERNRILDVQVVQSNEVQSSFHMELEGLKRCLDALEERNIKVTRVVTDRHVSVKKYLREEKPNIIHDHDVWHMANGIDKKLTAATKRKQGGDIKGWIPSIKNHMYWIASSSGDNGPLKRAKWLSVLNHIANQHSGHGDLYPECAHGELEPRQWLAKGSVPYKLLEKVVTSKLLVKDIERLSPMYQTFGLEVFHRVILTFAPKNYHFFYWSMVSRTYLAAIHYNENSENMQSKTKEGTARFTPVYPKRSRGEKLVVKPVKECPTYNYVGDLLEAVVERRKAKSSYSIANEDAQTLMEGKPPCLTAGYRKVDKEELILNRISRFNRL